MKKKVLLILGLLFCSSYAFASYYLMDYDFLDATQWTLDHASILLGKHIELAPDIKTLYDAPEAIVMTTPYKGGFFISLSEPSRIQYVKDGKILYEKAFENHSLLSNIKIINDTIYLLAFEKATLYTLSPSLEILSSTEIPSNYVWDIEEYKDTLYIGAGYPAALYTLKNDKLEKVKTVRSESNFIKMIKTPKYLYLLGDRFIYRFDGDTLMSVTGFQYSIFDAIAVDEDLYVVTSLVSDQVGINEGESTPESPSKEARFFRVTENGKKQNLLIQYDMNFLSLIKQGDNILIGTDYSNGFFSWNILENELRFTGYGQGQIAQFMKDKDDIYFMSNFPFGIKELLPSFSKTGTAISKAIETGGIARWGKPTIETTPVGHSYVEVYSQMGAGKDTSTWQDFRKIDTQVHSTGGSLFRYKVVLNSDNGKINPLFEGLNLSFLPEKEALFFTGFDFQEEDDFYHFSWELSSSQDSVFDVTLYPMHQNPILLVESTKAKEITIDTHDYPDGRYHLEINASYADNLNPELSSFMKTTPFVIKNTPTQILNLKANMDDDRLFVSFETQDSFPLLEVLYKTDKDDTWKNVYPLDQIFDTQDELFKFTVKGEDFHFIQIKTIDVNEKETLKGAFIK